VPDFSIGAYSYFLLALFFFVITGTSGDDVIAALGGNDHVNAGDGATPSAAAGEPMFFRGRQARISSSATRSGHPGWRAGRRLPYPGPEYALVGASPCRRSTPLWVLGTDGEVPGGSVGDSVRVTLPPSRARASGGLTLQQRTRLWLTRAARRYWGTEATC
jgi:hypothetical protein